MRPKPKVGDIWLWCWRGDDERVPVLILGSADRDKFKCLDIGNGETNIWTFEEEYMEGWKFIA